MIYKWSWGISLILIGLIEVGVIFQYQTLALGVALIIAGIAFIAGK